MADARNGQERDLSATIGTAKLLTASS